MKRKLKRKLMLVLRNPFVVPAKQRKAGSHGKTGKAKRRAEKMEIWERSLVTRHPAFNRTKDEFESLRSHQQDFNRMVSETAPRAGSDLIRSALTSRLQF